MHCRAHSLIGLCAVITLIAGCSRQPQNRYQPSDQNVAIGKVREWTFNQDQMNQLPDGTGVFSGTWAVRPEDDAPTRLFVLCQTGQAEFPAIVLSKDIYSDSTVSVHFKTISGQTDQAAGIIFRVKDKDNYYILRANALEDNVDFFTYASGRRSLLKEGTAKISSGNWHELKADVAGNRFQGFLDGKLVVEATDDSFQVGKIGLWTKADSVTCFDNVTVVAK